MNTAVLDRPWLTESDEVESLYTLIGKLINLKLHSEVDLIERLEEGLTVAHVHSLQSHANLTDAETYQLIASRRTLSRREAAGQRLTAEIADRVVRVARIIARAQLAFAGEPEYAITWLREPKSSLGDRTPFQVIATESGALAIEEQLIGIEHGMFA